MSLPEYSAYKDSGVEWIGKIPAHWEVKRLKYLGEFSKGGGISKSDLTEEGVPVCLYGDIYTKYTTSTYSFVRRTSLITASKSFELRRGDLLFTGSGETAEEIGKSIGYLGDTEAYAGGDILVFRPQQGDTLYLSFLLDSSPVQSEKTKHSKGDIIAHIYASQLRKFPIPLPPLEEQAEIAAYLEAKTARLDGLIERKERLLDLYAEERQALINRAVTRGLDPDAPTRDSGVEWLGEIPSHWEVKRLKYTIQEIKGGGTPNTEESSFWNGDIPWISPKDMKTKAVSSSKKMITQAGLEGSSTLLIDEGRILIVVRSGILKHTLPVAINTTQVTLNQDMKAIFPSDKLFLSFLYFLFRGLEKTILTVCSKIGATVDSIEIESLFNFFIPIPPLDEQIQIAEWIATKTGQLDRLTEKTQQQIAYLKEYKAALIAEVVTGKVDVRGLSVKGETHVTHPR